VALEGGQIKHVTNLNNTNTNKKTHKLFKVKSRDRENVLKGFILVHLHLKL